MNQATTTTITVPAAPTDKDRDGWRRIVTDLDYDAKGGFAILGHTVGGGDRITVTVGAVLVAVDTTTLGWEVSRYTGEEYAKKSAEVTVYLVTADGLDEKWRRSFKTSRFVGGRTVLGQITKLWSSGATRAAHVETVTEGQRPNRREDRCRWCDRLVPAGVGHVVGHGREAAVECWQECPTQSGWAAPPPAGTTCARCGVTVEERGSHRVMIREGVVGRWEHRHDADCLTTPVPPAESLAAQRKADDERDRAERKAAAAAAAERDERNRRNREKRAARKAAEFAAEQDRVAKLDIVRRNYTMVSNKGLWGGERACLDEVTVHLSDGTTTTRWGVTAPGVSEEFLTKADAQDRYRDFKWEKPAWQVDDSRNGGTCDECHRYKEYLYRAVDSSGIPGMVCGSCNGPSWTLSFA